MAYDSKNWRARVLKDDKGSTFNVWTCQRCGAMVGPNVSDRNTHDLWHDRPSH